MQTYLKLLFVVVLLAPVIAAAQPVVTVLVSEADASEAGRNPDTFTLTR